MAIKPHSYGTTIHSECNLNRTSTAYYIIIFAKRQKGVCANTIHSFESLSTCRQHLNVRSMHVELHLVHV